MPIYTKNGDDGTTNTIGNERKSKSSLVFEVLGTLDELNSVLGVLASEINFSEEAKDFIHQTQSNLFKIGSLVANPNSRSMDFDWLEDQIITLEKRIDEMDDELPLLKKFILPGGSNQAAKVHLSRSVCRRLERRVVYYYENTPVNKENFVLMYINRLSDFLFTLARYINLKLNHEEKVWKG